MFGGLLLAVGLLFLLGGAVDATRTTLFVRDAKPAVAEVVSSVEHRDRRGTDRCCTTVAFIVEADGGRLTGSWSEPVLLTPGSAVNVLYHRGPAYRPIRMLPNDEWALWHGARIGFRMGGTFAAMGMVVFLIGALLRARRSAST